MRRLWVSMGLLMVLSLLLSGCAGGAAVRQVSWPGLIEDRGTLYVANVDQIQAFDAVTGTLRWSFPEQASQTAGFYAAPVLAREQRLLIVAGMNDKKVYALQLADSQTAVPGIAWTFEGARGQYVGTGTVAGNYFIIGNGDGNVYALNLKDGGLAWNFTTRDRVWATPLVVSDTVYVASLDHNLYALALSDGTLRWQKTLAGAISSSPVAVGDSLWVGDFGDKLHQLDQRTGEERFAFTAKNWIWATPVVSGTSLYFSDVAGNVYALDSTNPETLLWETKLDDVLHGRPVLVQDGQRLLVPGHRLGKIYSLDTTDGTVLNWGTVLEDPGNLPGDLATDGERVFAMPILISERIRAFDVASGKLVWQYPPAETGQ